MKANIAAKNFRQLVKSDIGIRRSRVITYWSGKKPDYRTFVRFRLPTRYLLKRNLQKKKSPLLQG